MTYTCTKPQCYYCYATQPRIQKPEAILNAVTVPKEYNNLWSDEEIDILFQNINTDYDTLMQLIPKRTKQSIAQIKTVHAKKRGYRYIADRHFWVKD